MILKYGVWAIRDKEIFNCPFYDPRDLEKIISWAMDYENSDLHLGVFYRDQCNLAFTPSHMINLAGAGIVLCISCYESVG